MTLLSAAEAWPYEPAGGAYSCTASAMTNTYGVDLAQPLVATSAVFAAAAPPPPTEDAALPAAVNLAGCLTVEQYLCQARARAVGQIRVHRMEQRLTRRSFVSFHQFTSGNAGNPATTTFLAGSDGGAREASLLSRVC